MQVNRCVKRLFNVMRLRRLLGCLYLLPGLEHRGDGGIDGHSHRIKIQPRVNRRRRLVLVPETFWFFSEACGM